MSEADGLTVFAALLAAWVGFIWLLERWRQWNSREAREYRLLVRRHGRAGAARINLARSEAKLAVLEKFPDETAGEGPEP